MIRKWGIERLPADNMWFLFLSSSFLLCNILWWSATWSLHCNQIPLLSAYTYESSSVKIIKAVVLAFLLQELISYIT